MYHIKKRFLIKNCVIGSSWNGVIIIKVSFFSYKKGYLWKIMSLFHAKVIEIEYSVYYFQLPEHRYVKYCMSDSHHWDLYTLNADNMHSTILMAKLQ